MFRFYSRMVGCFLLASGFLASPAKAHYEKPLHLGHETLEELDRVGQILLRCGGRPAADKSDFIQNNVRTAHYFLAPLATDDICESSRVVCSNGPYTWFDMDSFEDLPYRERTLRMLHERLVQRPISGSEAVVQPLMASIRIALPLITDQYFGKSIAPKEEELNAIANIPGLLRELGLSDENPDEIRETCIDHFRGTSKDSYSAPQEQMMLFKDKEKIFDQRARESITKAGDNLIGSSGDTVAWTGIYIASQAHRYRMTGDDEAIRNIEPSLWAFHDLHKVTGTKTLVARRMELEPNQNAVLPAKYYRGAKGYENYKWRSHVSWDMYVGYLYGIGESWEVIQDPKLKDAIREDMREIALGFIEDGMAIDAYDTYLSSEPDGCFVDHVRCNFLEKFAKKILHHFAVRAGAAIRALNLLQVAGYVTEDPRILSAYQGLIDKKWWKYAHEYGLQRTEDILETWLPIVAPLIRILKGPGQLNVEAMRDPVGMYLGHLSHYMLVRFEKNPQIRELYLEGFKKQVHNPVKYDYNTFFDFLLGIYTKPSADEVDTWVDTLRRFPLDDYTHRTNSTNPDIEKYSGLDAKGHWNMYAYEPLPLEIRPMHGFAWQVNSYKLDGTLEDACPGVPYLASYWLGRYAGFITPEE